MEKDDQITQITITVTNTASADLNALKEKRVVLKKFRDISSDESATKFDLYGEETIGEGALNEEEEANDDNYISSEDETLRQDDRETRRLSIALREEAKFGCLQLKEKEYLYEQKRASWQDNIHKIPQMTRVLVHDDDLLSQSSDNNNKRNSKNEMDQKSNLYKRTSRLKIH
jgi:hypothetical protein